jgi:branched-chain amino acid transport system permease protein
MNRSWILGIVVSVIAVAMTWLVSDFRLFQFATVATWAVAMLGLNILTGYNGQISLGHGAFMGIGMFAVAVLNRDHGMSYPVAFLVAFALTFIVGILIGIPALRLPGTSLALITLALAMAFPQVLRKYDSVTGGVQGINVSGDRQFRTGVDSLSTDQARYLLVVGITIVMFWIGWNLVRGRWGLAMMSVRDNPVAAASMGVNLPQTKVVAFGLSAGLAGLAGAMQMMLFNFASPESVSLLVSISLLTGIVIGGLGTVAGAVIGGFFIVYMPNWALDFSRELSLSRDLPPGAIYGVVIILVMLLAPGGVMGLFRRAFVWASGKRGRDKAAAEEAAEFPTEVEEPVVGAHGI